jgi:transcriptional regulator with XRE-family HTH domain
MAQHVRTKDPGESAYYAAFRARLKDLRTGLGYSQSEMAEALGVSLDRYKKYEIRDRFPAHLLNKLALDTNSPLEYVVTGHIRRTR